MCLLNVVTIKYWDIFPPATLQPFASMDYRSAPMKEIYKCPYEKESLFYAQRLVVSVKGEKNPTQSTR